MTRRIIRRGGDKMAKLYKLDYRFKDGEKWEFEKHGVELTTDQIAYMLQEFQKSDNIEIENQSSGDKKKVSEIKSIELRF
ncbi:hypothetical protein [Priestia flexa]|uniref:Uncharacterized protein n=1 Tax=Priestia flexa TaxID=86664 RepID=A0A8I1SQN9_9BACI|nr:hypothetical protein [Priestia flexa]MBN8253596.1 hypothetical protein [Priestia flexa]